MDERRAVAASVGLGLALNQSGGPDWRQAFEAVRLTLPEACAVQVDGWDVVRSRYVVIAGSGYPPAVSADLTGMHRSVWGRQLLASRRPLIIDDGLGFRDSPHYRDWLAPAGYDDGIGVCLRDEVERPIGFLQMSAERAGAFGEPARRFVGEIARIVSRHVDPRAHPGLDAVFDAGWAGNRIAADGRVLPLHGRLDSPLGRDVAIAAVARRFAALHSSVLAFVWPQGRDWWQGVLVGEQPTDPAGSSGSSGAVLMTRPYANENGLTVREVDVLTGIATGFPNPAIAADLTIGRRTVETYVERLLAKLRCASRSELAALAARNGLLRPSAEPGRLGDVSLLTRDPVPVPLVRR